jgi:hypothetical protein
MIARTSGQEKRSVKRRSYALAMMITVNVWCDNEEEKRLTVDSARAVHEAIAEAFGCERQQVQRVLFGDADARGREL